MTKNQLITAIREYNDEAPREILYSMKKDELERYLDDLRKEFDEEKNDPVICANG